MTTVLILEDCIESQKALAAIMKEYRADIHALFASSYQEALTCLKNESQIDIFFLDINLNGSDPLDKGGLLFAKKVREISRYAFTPIVFITSAAELELVSYRETQCYSYLIKPYEKESVVSVLDKVTKTTKQSASQQITVKKDGINYRLNVSDIICIEAVKRGICLHLKKEDLELRYSSIKKIMDQLPKEEFIQCHRMFVVRAEAVDYVDLVNQIVHLKEYDGAVEIGVTYKNEIRRWMNEGLL